MKRQPVQSEDVPAFIGIDYHKADLLCARLAPAYMFLVGRPGRSRRCSASVVFRPATHDAAHRVHRLLGGQHEVKLPQCSDLFGRKGDGLPEKAGVSSARKTPVKPSTGTLERIGHAYSRV
jgi:hypothetical protein